MIDLIGNVLPFACVLFLWGFGVVAILDNFDVSGADYACPCGRERMRKFVCLGPGDRGPIEAQLTRICPYCSAKEPSGDMS